MVIFGEISPIPGVELGDRVIFLGKKWSLGRKGGGRLPYWGGFRYILFFLVVQFFFFFCFGSYIILKVFHNLKDKWKDKGNLHSVGP